MAHFQRKISPPPTSAVLPTEHHPLCFHIRHAIPNIDRSSNAARLSTYLSVSPPWEFAVTVPRWGSSQAWNHRSDGVCQETSMFFTISSRVNQDGKVYLCVSASCSDQGWCVIRELARRVQRGWCVHGCVCQQACVGVMRCLVCVLQVAARLSEKAARGFQNLSQAPGARARDRERERAIEQPKLNKDDSSRLPGCCLGLQRSAQHPRVSTHRHFSGSEHTQSSSSGPEQFGPFHPPLAKQQAILTYPVGRYMRLQCRAAAVLLRAAVCASASVKIAVICLETQAQKFRRTFGSPRTVSKFRKRLTDELPYVWCVCGLSLLSHSLSLSLSLSKML